jgi:hypothetical protein
MVNNNMNVNNKNKIITLTERAVFNLFYVPTGKINA